MKTIILEVEFEYDKNMMGAEPDAAEWWKNVVLQNDGIDNENHLYLYSQHTACLLGEIRVKSIRGDL